MVDNNHLDDSVSWRVLIGLFLWFTFWASVFIIPIIMNHEVNSQLKFAEEDGISTSEINQNSFDIWAQSGQCEVLQQYPESIISEDDMHRLARYDRAGQLLALVRGRQLNDGHDHERAAEARRILEPIDAVCPEWSNEVFVIGLHESLYLQRGLRGDWRKWKHKPEDGTCPDGWESTARGCYTQDRCDPDVNENCIPTSCSYWQIRDIYRGRPTCSELIYDIDVGIEWACNWVASNWPNVAAYNAGHGGARAGRAQPYANRVYIGIELLRGRGDINEWTFENRRFVHGNE
jgi:hypothetical protein